MYEQIIETPEIVFNDLGSFSAFLGGIVVYNAKILPNKNKEYYTLLDKLTNSITALKTFSLQDSDGINDIDAGMKIVNLTHNLKTFLIYGKHFALNNIQLNVRNSKELEEKIKYYTGVIRRMGFKTELIISDIIILKIKLSER